LQLVILDKTTKTFLGCIGLQNIKAKRPLLGLWIKESVWGRGYGREATLAVVCWAKKNLDYNEILYVVSEKNIASVKIAERIGVKMFKKNGSKNKKEKKLIYFIKK